MTARWRTARLVADEAGPVGTHPAELATVGILATVCAVLVAGAMAGAPVGRWLMVHGAILIAFVVISRAAGSGEGSRVRAVAICAVMFTLYGTLAHVPFVAIPWVADPWLETADRILFRGVEPVLSLEPLAATPWGEWAAASYAWFIPFLWISIVLALAGREPRYRDEFVTGFAVLYASSFLGYLLLPARGPIVHMAGQFTLPIDGGVFHRLVLRAVDQSGGPHGAFPSVHLGASLFLVLLDFRRGDPLRALIYLPFLALLAFATIALRYHYAIDLIAGAVLAILAARVGAIAIRGAWRAPIPGVAPGARAAA